MTDELESKLRRHLGAVDDAAVASTTDVASSARRAGAHRQRRRRVGVGVAAVVAVVGAATAIVATQPGGSSELSIGSALDSTAPTATTTVESTTAPPATAAPTTLVPTTPPPPKPEASAWTALPSDPRGPTSDPSVVWTGSEAIAIGGLDESGEPRVSAAAFDPTDETWRTLAAPPIDNPTVASQFVNQLVVWTGTEVLVLGGGTDGPRRAIKLPDFAYDPAADAWRSIPSPNGEVSASTPATWTGDELLLWPRSGPSGPGSVGEPTAFDPVTSTWRDLALPPAVQREHAASVWTGTEWVIWGGRSDGRDLDDGVAYDPAIDTWRTIAESPLSVRRVSGVWTGSEMIIAAGSSGNEQSPFAIADGAAYDPATDSWRPIADGFAHPGFVPIWTGTHLVMFAKGAAAVYDPETDRWLDTCCNDTGGGVGGTPVWTGSTIVLLGSHEPDAGGSTFTPDR